MKKLIRITTVPISLLVLLRSQLKFMSNHFDVLAVSSGGSVLDEVAAQAGVRTMGIEMTRKITPLKDLKALWDLYKLMQKEKPEMVHTHTPKAGLLGMIAAMLAGVPLRLHTVAGMPLLEKKGMTRKLLELTEMITYFCATRVYPNSQNMKKIIEANKYCQAAKLKVIGNGSSNGIDTTYFDPHFYTDHAKAELRSSLKISVKDVVFCFIGRMVADKGVSELIRAFNNVQTHLPQAKLLLIGPHERDLDPLDEDSERQIAENPGIIWRDFQNDVRPYLAISDMFVFPSYREGFPNVVMQAGAMGLPCIVSNINGCNEIIRHGENGLIVPVKDVQALQAAMEQMTQNQELREKLKSNARPIITNNYDQQYIMDELLKEYHLLNQELHVAF